MHLLCHILRSRSNSTKLSRSLGPIDSGCSTRCIIARCFSSRESNDLRAPPIRAWELLASDAADGRIKGVMYTSQHEGPDSWKKVEYAHAKGSESDATIHTTATKVEKWTHATLGHMLPAQYPQSVAPGYFRFAGFCFTASVAGSATMVLSTQTLLLAVGVVGSNAQQAGIMAGAFNWVMKDFVGQLGGVLFASQMGKTRAFDADPKRWRMVAAMALDGATLLEILSPLFPSVLVLPVASIANVGKNIGFLTASASRASLHQSVAITGNLGDVTAKAGSQSILASLIGTSIGIGMSSLLSHDIYNFALGFCVLGVIHQGCNYLSLQSVPLAYFNRQRAHILVERYLSNNVVMTPTEVGKEESFFPLVSDDTTESWLTVGSALDEICPTPSDLESMLVLSQDQKYIIRASSDGRIELMFFKKATGQDLIRGMFHASMLRQSHQHEPKEGTEETIRAQVVKKYPIFLEQIRAQGWSVGTEVTTLEDSNARRLEIERIV